MPRRPDTPHMATAPPDVVAAPVHPAEPDAPPTLVSKETVHIAVQGCCHGELDKIYAACREHEAATGLTISFLLCCGDFQSVRNRSDLDSMAVPDKYKVLGDFHKYYSGAAVAPYLTIFIGGNHEASNVLFHEYYGGFVAPNIYYLGHSGVVEVCGVVVAGVSGIYKGRDFQTAYPVPPYTSQTVREAYHVRHFEIEKLRRFSAAVYAADSSLRRSVDIVMSHDWPVGVTKFGDEFRLLKLKPYFEDDLKHGALGNPHLMPLLELLRPKYWLSAHLHCHFTAKIPHTKVLPGGRGAAVVCSPTQFVALDKCVHQRRFLDFVDVEVPHGGQRNLRHHPLWLRVVRQTHPPPLNTAGRCHQTRPGLADGDSEQDSDVRCSSTAQLLSRLGLSPMPTADVPPQPAPVASQATASLPTVRIGGLVPQPLPPQPAPQMAGSTEQAECDDSGCDWVEDVGMDHSK
jgi:hypothetical protein